jgi:hypothetical protein
MQSQVLKFKRLLKEEEWMGNLLGLEPVDGDLTPQR